MREHGSVNTRLNGSILYYKRENDSGMIDDIQT